MVRPSTEYHEQPVYRYLFSKAQPPLKPGFEKKGQSVTTQPATFKGAPHAFEIEYAMGNLQSNPEYAWTAEDEKVSSMMMEYFSNFIKKGNPNGKGLPQWDEVNKSGPMMLMNLGAPTKQENETDLIYNRYLFLEKQYMK